MTDTLGRAALVWLAWIGFFVALCGVPLPAAVLLGAQALMMHDVFVGITPRRDKTPLRGDGFTVRPRGGWK